MKKESLAQYAIKGTDDDWSKALVDKNKKPSIISVKIGEKRDAAAIEEDEPQRGVDWNKNKKKRFDSKGDSKRGGFKQRGGGGRGGGRKDKFFK